MPTFEFPLTGVPCSNCAGSLVYCLTDQNPPSFFKFTIPPSVSPNLQKLTVEIDDPRVTEEEVRRYIIGAFEGTPYKLVVEDAAPYWRWGSLGLGLGGLILILSLTVGFSFGPLRWAIAVVSLGVTLILGEESWRQAKIEFQRKKPGMDSLFILSTSAASVMSMMALFMPTMPLMFEASLFIFGFRHIGIALKKSVYAKPNLPVHYQRLVNAQQRKPGEIEFRPGETLQIRAGEMIPIDGWLLPQTTAASEQSYAMNVSKIRGSYIEEQLWAGDPVQAGMVAKTDCMMQVGLGHSVHYFQTRPKAFCPQGQIWIYLQGDAIHVESRTDTTNKNVHWDLSAQDFAQDSDHFAKIVTALQLNTVTHLPKAVHQQIPRILINYAQQHGLTQTTSAMARLEKELEDGGSRAAPIQEKVEHVLHYFLPIVLGIALISGAVVAYFFTPMIALRCMISILVSACPCTLGFVTPLVMDFARAKGKDIGIAFSQSDAIQRLSEVDTALIDIHGTATKGETLAHIDVIDPIRTQEIYMLLARLEQHSSQHVGKAIYTAVKGDDLLRDQGLAPLIIEKHAMGGIGTTLNGKEYKIGNHNLLKHLGLDEGESEPNTNYLLEKESNTSQYRIVAKISIHDPLREDTALTVQQMKQRGLKVYLMTGADQKTAEKYARDLPGLDGIYAGLADGEAKAAKVRALQGEEFKLAKILMVGDGANDGPAMQAAYASIAMKHALSDEGAHYQAKARILNGKMLTIIDALDTAKLAMWRLKLNLYLSFMYNLAVVLLTNVLVLAFGIVLHPGVCAALMVMQVGFIILSTYYFKQQPLPSRNLVSQSMFGEEVRRPPLTFQTNLNAGRVLHGK